MAASKNDQFAMANWDCVGRVRRIVPTRKSKGTDQGASEVDADGSFVPSQRKFWERAQTDAARVVIGSREGHAKRQQGFGFRLRENDRVGTVGMKRWGILNLDKRFHAHCDLYGSLEQVVL